MGARVEWLGDGGFGFGEGAGLGDGIGEGCGDVEFFGAADHLRGAGWIFVVVPDSDDDF